MNLFKTENYYKEIVNYYDSSQLMYRLFAYGGVNTLGMHHGFWYKDTKNLQEALTNENREVADMGEIKSGYRVLDAGCGVGGTAIYVAKNTGAKVFGITLSRNQVSLAKHYAKKHDVEKLTDFQLQDYTKTNFPNNYFDVVYGVESICHAYSKEAFLKEAFRVLKHGGKLVIADGYTTHRPKNKNEKRIIDDFVKAFALKELVTYKKMSEAIKNTRFIKIKEINKEDNIIPAVNYFVNIFTRFRYLLWIMSFLFPKLYSEWKRNIDAVNCEDEGVKLKLATYYIHYAQKP